MKKIFVLALAALTVVLMPNVHAMDKNELLSKIKASYTINGESTKLDSSYVVLAERYLNENNLKESDMFYISSEIDNVVKVLQDNKTTDVNKLSTSAKDQLKQIAEDITANTQVKVSIDKTNGLTIYNTDNSVFTVIEKNPIKYTDSVYPYALGITILLISCGIVLAKRIKKENA
jgi:hypothetical protein